MHKVINDSKNITVSELVNKLMNDSGLIIFYYSRNTVTPVFFKSYKQKYGFHHPCHDYKPTYTGDTFKESIQKVVDAGRELIVLEKDEINKIFKVPIK